MFTVAAVTFAAGTLTAANGAAEMIEAGTGFNFVRDGIMGGNQKSYEAYRDTMSTISEIGTMICGSYIAAKGGNVCFVAGTLVKTEDGETPIEEISAGDLVWAWDEATGDVALKEVIETYVNETNELVHLFVNGEEIIATPTHPFYSPVKGWTDAVQLRAGDILVLVNGEYVVVEKVQHEILEAPVTVYNFNVESYHTYFITSCGILVHNKCSGSYEIEFESGKNYVGKGSERRMNVSAKIHSALNNDPVVSMSWEYAPDTQTAFVDEYFKMAVRGVNNPNTYNLIWSPGRKIFFSNWM
jgi:hypothetical protein